MLNDNIKKQVIEYRQKLHQIPEIGFQEFKTQAYIKKELTKMGYIVEEVANTGIIAYKKGIKKGAIAFRADMDALAIMEKTSLPFASQHPGYMHACGHDGHMSILLGLALYLSELDVIQDIVFIFQPAEENLGGAKVIVEEGYIEKYQIQKIFGLHLLPELSEGKIGLSCGALMAQVGEFDIKIHAKSSHGAMPHKGIDGIFVASQLINSYQSIISRNLDPLTEAVVTIGKIYGGEARNIIASEVTLNGTIRAFNDEVYQTIKRRITEINKGLEKMYSVVIDTELRDMYPSLINDYELYLFMKENLDKNQIVEIKPMMIAEDFSYYLQKIPGYFFILGTKNEELGYTHPLHSCYFNFREEVLFTGIELYIKLCEKFHII
ncbi:MAG TPA: M20 family metallopeptidase [Haloplasmataceae bacterium]